MLEFQPMMVVSNSHAHSYNVLIPTYMPEIHPKILDSLIENITDSSMASYNAQVS